mmetsp:Transcript_31830/g.58694  ORF Transcript_31830/g.58694 Transcript_31830/m.58694 type:complete len:211 (-) Transcript_31830:311-943(-)
MAVAREWCSALLPVSVAGAEGSKSAAGSEPLASGLSSKNVWCARGPLAMSATRKPAGSRSRWGRGAIFLSCKADRGRPSCPLDPKPQTYRHSFIESSLKHNAMLWLWPHCTLLHLPTSFKASTTRGYGSASAMPPEPSWPLPPAPHAKTSPRSVRVSVWRLPAATSKHRETRSALTCSGRKRERRSPSPSCPCSLQPQAQSNPVAVCAIV